MFRFTRCLVPAVLAAPLLAAPAGPRPGVDWPSFRGPRASGIAEGYPTPIRWNAATRENVRWKTAIPGLGHSSPVVWGDLVCVTTAVSTRPDQELKVGLYGDIRPVDDEGVQTWKVYCLDKRDGRVRWERTANTSPPRIKRHTKSTHANSTLATDGHRVVALFGSEGLYAYDLKGRLLWKKDLGLLDAGFYMVPPAQWGFGSSPVVHDGKVYVLADVQKDSFVAAFDAATGRELWRTPRSDVPTWGTPTLVEAEGGAQLVVNGWKQIGAYDPASGRELWRMRGLGDIPVPTPVAAHGLVFLTNAHGAGSPIYAVRTSARGDLTLPEGQTSSEHVAWSQIREGAYIPTPLVYGDHLYVCRDIGVRSAYEARTGRRLYQERLAEGRTGFTASPVAADGKLYLTSEDGEVYVVKSGPQFELLGQNALGEVALATPAVSEGTLYFRTRGHVMAVGGKPKR